MADRDGKTQQNRPTLDFYPQEDNKEEGDFFFREERRCLTLSLSS
jgi:hypothetical protein